MEAIKKIATKSLILAIALIAMNYAYKYTFLENDLEEYSGVNQKIKIAKDAEILYLGDCSDSYFGENNKGEKGISQLLDSLLPNKKVATISETVFHAGMYNAILQQVPKNSKINTVIVTMNLRSFSAQVMNTYINNSINQRLIMLDDNYPTLLNRFFLTFKKAKHYTGEEYVNMKVKTWKETKFTHQNILKHQTMYDWKSAYENGKYNSLDSNQTTKGAAHIANYAFQINTATNPRINDFDNIVKLTEKRNWKLIFHLLPENISESKKLVGEDLTNLINYNRKLLHKRYSTNNVQLIDNMELLNNSTFIENLPNSHYHYNGRRQMAGKIVEYFNNKSDN
jgi:hypothetical protein